ncbi:unnamed protein product, partial [Dovyalis caffra]
MSRQRGDQSRTRMATPSAFVNAVHAAAPSDAAMNYQSSIIAAGSTLAQHKAEVQASNPTAWCHSTPAQSISVAAQSDFTAAQSTSVAAQLP